MAVPVPLGSGEQLSTPNFSEVASSLPLAYIMQQLFPGGLPTPNQVSGNTTPTPSAGVGEGGGSVATSGQPFNAGGGTTFTAGEGVGSSPSGGGTAETGNSAQPSTSQGMQEAANIIGQALAALATSVTGPFGSLIGFGANVQNPNSLVNSISKSIIGETLADLLGLTGGSDADPLGGKNASETGLSGSASGPGAGQGSAGNDTGPGGLAGIGNSAGSEGAATQGGAPSGPDSGGLSEGGGGLSGGGPGLGGGGDDGGLGPGGGFGGGGAE